MCVNDHPDRSAWYSFVAFLKKKIQNVNKMELRWWEICKMKVYGSRLRILTVLGIKFLSFNRIETLNSGKTFTTLPIKHWKVADWNQTRRQTPVKLRRHSCKKNS